MLFSASMTRIQQGWDKRYETLSYETLKRVAFWMEVGWVIGIVVYPFLVMLLHIFLNVAVEVPGCIIGSILHLMICDETKRVCKIINRIDMQRELDLIAYTHMQRLGLGPKVSESIAPAA